MLVTFTYDQAVAALESLVDFEKLGFRRHFAGTVSLETIAALLQKLGNPQRGLPCVHVAGTKGKGSVCAILEAILLAAGLPVGLFSSPHLVSFRERIRFGGRLVTEEEIAALVAQVWPALQQQRAEGLVNPATFFEAYTALAYLYFRAQQAKLAIMEVGLGGRLDSTNTCEPVVCAITTLGLDHTEILGDTIEQIAYEKAGILKPGIPAVLAPQVPAAAAVLREVAGRVGAPLRPAPEILEIAPGSRLAVPESGAALPTPRQQVTLRLSDGPLTVELPLPGTHQAHNLAVALGVVEALREQGQAISAEAIQEGCRRVRWPGRLQVAGARPWIILDAAHNQPSAAALAQALPGLLEYDRLIFLLGLSAEKDALGFCAELAPLADVAILTQAHLSRALPAANLESLTANLWRDHRRVEDVAAALAQAQTLATERDCIVITGSFYVVGEAMEELGIGPETFVPAGS